jgi:hypothetical protein
MDPRHPCTRWTGAESRWASLRDAKGEAITWRRDDEEQCKFHLTLPAGVDRVVANLDYICNQPSVNSSGIDSFGNSLLGVINWNTVLLYPEGASIDTATARVNLRLPEGWRFGTALKTEKEAPRESPSRRAPCDRSWIARSSADKTSATLT